MDNNELESHIKEYEKEYRWLAKFYKRDYVQMEMGCGWWFGSNGKTVEIMRQYANDVQKEPKQRNPLPTVKEQESEPIYWDNLGMSNEQREKLR
jgi:hypothetical protein